MRNNFSHLRLGKCEIMELYSAAEIAAMNLADLPSTTRGIQLRAKKEDWYYETKIGLGGVRKLYRIPELYLPGYVPPGANNKPFRVLQEEAIEEYAKNTAKEAVVTMGAQVDSKRLALAIQYVDSYLLDHNVTLSPTRRSEIIVIVYNFLKGNTGQGEVEHLLKLVA